MIGYRFWISAGTFLIVPDHLLNHFFDFLRYFIFPDRGGIGQFEWKKACTSRLNHDSTKFFYLLCLLMVDVLLCVCNALLSVVVLRSLPWDQIPSWNWSSTPFQPFQPFQPFTHCPFSRHLSEREREGEVERFWYVLIILERSWRIVTLVTVVVSCCTPFGAFCSEDHDLLQHRLHANQLIFGRWCCLLIPFWSDVGQMLVIVGNWTTKSRHQKINTNLMFNTLAESQSFWIRNGKKVGNSFGTQQIEF